MSVMETRLSEAQLLDWLRLIRSESIGPNGIMAQPPEAIRRAITT